LNFMNLKVEQRVEEAVTYMHIHVRLYVYSSIYIHIIFSVIRLKLHQEIFF